MTAPLRRFLLNRQIALEARSIAHAWTKTCQCNWTSGDGDIDDEHTKNCNALKRQIQQLAMSVKLAAHQRPLQPVATAGDDDRGGRNVSSS